MILESSGAHVVKDSITYEDMENIAREGLSPRPEYVVKIDALVVREQGAADPNFVLKLNGVESRYKHGDEMQLAVTATQTCYLNLFTLGSDGKVYHIFPNEFEVENTLRAGTRHLPGSSAYAFSTELLDERTTGSETLFMVATKDSIAFHMGDLYTPDAGYAEIRRAGLEQLMTWLLRIPRDRRVEVAESYVIRR